MHVLAHRYLCLTRSPGVGSVTVTSFCTEISRLSGFSGRAKEIEGLPGTEGSSQLGCCPCPLGGFGSFLCLVSIDCVLVCHVIEPK